MIATNAFKQAVVGTYTASDTVIELNSISDTVGASDYLPDGGFNLILYDGLFGNPADANNAGDYEILECTGVNYATNEITVVREVENTTAVTIDASSWQVVYGATVAFFAQFEDADATILKQADVVDTLVSTSIIAPLSANQGKQLNDQLDGKVSKTSDTGAAEIPSGTTAQRDETPASGYFRFNSTDTKFEGYDGVEWGEIGGGEGAPLTVEIDDTDSPYTATNERIIIADTTTGNITINLPNLTTIVGTENQRPILIYKYDYSQNVIFIETNGAQLINGKDRDILAGIQQAVIFHPTTEGWTVEAQNGRSIAELAEFFVPYSNKGKVLQVVQATYSTEVTITSATPQDSGLTATITPSSATSKILVMITQPTAVSRPAEQAFGGVQVLRGSTVIYKPYNDTFAASIGILAVGSTSIILAVIQSYQYLDSPATTSAVTYKTQGRIPSVGTDILIRFQGQDIPSVMILMEIEE